MFSFDAGIDFNLVNNQSLYLGLSKLSDGQPIDGVKDCAYCPHIFDFKLENDEIWQEFFFFDIGQNSSSNKISCFQSSITQIFDTKGKTFNKFAQNVSRGLYRLIGHIYPFLVPQRTLNMFVVRFCVKYLQSVEQKYDVFKKKSHPSSLEVSYIELCFSKLDDFVLTDTYIEQNGELVKTSSRSSSINRKVALSPKRFEKVTFFNFIQVNKLFFILERTKPTITNSWKKVPERANKNERIFIPMFLRTNTLLDTNTPSCSIWRCPLPTFIFHNKKHLMFQIQN